MCWRSSRTGSPGSRRRRTADQRFGRPCGCCCHELITELTYCCHWSSAGGAVVEGRAGLRPAAAGGSVVRAGAWCTSAVSGGAWAVALIVSTASLEVGGAAGAVAPGGGVAVPPT